MVYGYIRVSSDKQTVENQRYEINTYCEKNNLAVEKRYEETVTGTKEYEKRKLGKLLSRLHEGDILLCSELSRLGRSLMMIMEILSLCAKHKVTVITIKDHFKLDDSIESKVLSFAFGLCAEIERNLISQRTKEALQYRRAQGIHIGRPKGRKSECKLAKFRSNIERRLSQKRSINRISRRLHCHRDTLNKYLRSIGLK